MSAPADQTNEHSPIPVRSFFLLSEIWRATMWAIGGCILIAGVMGFVPALGPQRPLGERVCAAAVFLAFAACLSQFLLHRIRVDQHGISRRILWWWDLWAWESFTSGEVRRGVELSDYEDPSRPWWRRRLRLGLLEESDATAINALIKRVWTPPPPEPIPETLTLELSWPDKRVVEIDSTGITVTKTGEPTVYRWNEVGEIEIWRLEADRPDFRELRLQFADQKIELRRFSNDGEECQIWQGSSSESIAVRVNQFADRSRIRDWALHGPPRSLQELDARELRDTTKSTAALRQGLWALRVFWGVIGLTPLILPWPKGLLVAGFYVPLAFAVHWMYRDNVRKVAERRIKRESQCRQFDES